MQNFAKVFFAVWTSVPVGYYYRSGRTNLCHVVVVSLTLGVSYTAVAMAVGRWFTVGAVRRTDCNGLNPARGQPWESSVVKKKRKEKVFHDNDVFKNNRCSRKVRLLSVSVQKRPYTHASSLLRPFSSSSSSSWQSAHEPIKYFTPIYWKYIHFIF